MKPHSAPLKSPVYLWSPHDTHLQGAMTPTECVSFGRCARLRAMGHAGMSSPLWSKTVFMSRTLMSSSFGTQGHGPLSRSALHSPASFVCLSRAVLPCHGQPEKGESTWSGLYHGASSSVTSAEPSLRRCAKRASMSNLVSAFVKWTVRALGRGRSTTLPARQRPSAHLALTSSPTTKLSLERSMSFAARAVFFRNVHVWWRSSVPRFSVSISAMSFLTSATMASRSGSGCDVSVWRLMRSIVSSSSEYLLSRFLSAPMRRTYICWMTSSVYTVESSVRRPDRLMVMTCIVRFSAGFCSGCLAGAGTWGLAVVVLLFSVFPLVGAGLEELQPIFVFCCERSV
eukprot:PhM_4_TR8789/c0_g1_i1/m.49532